MALKMRRGFAKFAFCPSVANPSAPTQAELTAGTQFAAKLSEMSGFDAKSTTIDVPNFATRQTGKISGDTSFSDSSMTLYEDDTSNPEKTVLAKDTNGFLLFFPFGATVSTSKVDVFQVTVNGNNRQYTAANEAAKYLVEFAVTSVTQDAIMGS